MKRILALFIASFFYVSTIHAQDTTMRRSVDLTYPHKKHCRTTRIGEGFMIGGGAVVVTSGIVGLAYNYSNRDYIKKHGDGETMFFVAFGAIGLNVAFDGLVVFIIGKVYEHKHKERFSISSSKNEVGLAYHF